MSNIRRIAINTGGGDAPGLNAVIQAVVYAATGLGWEVLGVRDGYDGLLAPDRFVDSLVRLDRERVRNIAHLGGTILGTTNRSNPFSQKVVAADGNVQIHDRSDDVIRGLRSAGVDRLVVVGGDGSIEIAYRLSQKGLAVVGVPKTIDNDLESTTLTFGFDSAVAFATECIDPLHSTAEAHRRIIVVEVMGRHAGWIALNGGIAGRADAILILEIPYDLDKLAAHLRDRTTGSRSYAIVVVAEGAKPIDGQYTVRQGAEGGDVERLGGVGDTIADHLQKLTGRECRAVILGHLLRGGSPTALDRLLGLSFGAAAVKALAEGHQGVMVALDPPHISYVPFDKALERLKTVPTNGYCVVTARALDICFGD